MKPSGEQERTEAELRRIKDVVAEITAENLELKRLTERAYRTFRERLEVEEPT